MDDGMDRRGARDRGARWSLGVGLIVVALGFVACSGAASPSPSARPTSEPSLTPTVEAIEPTPTVGPTATPGLETLSKSDIVFGEDPLMARGVLDVYWPVAPGPWRVAVMFHGNPGPVTKSYLGPHAERVAQLGYVVFVANWGMSGGAAYNALLPHEQAEADAAQAACAIAFAAQEAPRYGGDPAGIIVFGHSAGANIASVVAFKPPEPSTGCFADTRVEGDVLIAWEGDWLMAGTPSYWDPIHAADPATFDAITPWAHIASRPELHVIILESENNGLDRDAKDALGPDGWLTVRDPSGAFTAAFQAMGAFDDDNLTLHEWQTVLADRLHESGNLVSFDIMPGSTHEYLSKAGWVVFLDAFMRAAALAG
jgi:dienelactone hydrolase